MVLAIASTHQLSFGSCASPDLLNKFVPSSFRTSFFISYHSKNVPWDTKDCSTFNTNPIGPSIVVLTNTQNDLSKNSFETTTGTLTFTDKSKGTVSGSKWVTGDFRFIVSGSTLWAYSCTPYLFGLFKNEYVWIFATSPPNSEAKVNDLSTVLPLVKSFKSADFVAPVHGMNCIYPTSSIINVTVRPVIGYLPSATD